MAKVNCLGCGCEIHVSKIDFKQGTHPKYCPNCTVVSKREVVKVEPDDGSEVQEVKIDRRRRGFRD
jgi:hypothetical protein